MDSIEETRRKRLNMLLKKQTQASLAAEVGLAPAQVSQWVNQSIDKKTGKPRVMDSSSARKIEEKKGLDPAWMDQPVTDERLDGLYLEVVALSGRFKAALGDSYTEIVKNKLEELAASIEKSVASFAAPPAESKKSRDTTSENQKVAAGR